jgi:hypothetical protein
MANVPCDETVCLVRMHRLSAIVCVLDWSHSFLTSRPDFLTSRGGSLTFRPGFLTSRGAHLWRLGGDPWRLGAHLWRLGGDPWRSGDE